MGLEEREDGVAEEDASTVAWRLMTEAGSLVDGERFVEALNVCEEVVARFGHETDDAVREPVARAELTKALSLGNLGRSEDEDRAYDHLVGVFGDSPDEQIRLVVAWAIGDWADSLFARGRFVEALAACEDALDRLGRETDEATRERIVRAERTKALSLRKLGRSEEEDRTYDRLMAVFGDSPEFVTSVRHYEMLELLCDSPSGRAALRIPELKRFASVRINEAQQLAGWVWQQQEEAAGVAAARIFTAEAYFVGLPEWLNAADD